MFSKIFYINLDHRADRNNNTVDQLKKLDLLNKTERISGIYGLNLDINKISPTLITKQGKDDALNPGQKVYTYLTKGAIGCALSHRKAYEKIINDNIDAALILEDDITIDSLFNKKLQTLRENIPEDYDILFIGYHNTSLKHFNPQINEYYLKPKKLYGLFGYIVTNEGARKLLDIFPITYQIDTEIPKHFDKINAYAVTPNKRLIYSDQSQKATKFGTDIQLRYTEPFSYKNNEILLSVLLIVIFVIVLIILVLWLTKLIKKIE